MRIIDLDNVKNLTLRQRMEIALELIEEKNIPTRRDSFELSTKLFEAETKLREAMRLQVG